MGQGQRFYYDLCGPGAHNFKWAHYQLNGDEMWERVSLSTGVRVWEGHCPSQTGSAPPQKTSYFGVHHWALLRAKLLLRYDMLIAVE